VNEEKQRIRNLIKERRTSLSKEEISEAGRCLAELFFEIPDEDLKKALKHAKTIGLYRAVGGEVPCDMLAGELEKRGFKTAFPRVEESGIVFRTASVSDETSFAPGAFNIPEPLATCGEAAPEVVIVPALAYNDEGARLGMGGGYYDKYSAAHKAFYIGVVYDFQICSQIPVEEHDMYVDLILPLETEE